MFFITTGVPTEERAQPSDESNLLYVAVTRAKKCLQISPTVYRLLRICGENFKYPVSSELLRSQGVTMRCAETERDFNPLTCTVVRRKIRLVSKKFIQDNHELAEILFYFTDNRNTQA